ncbi:MAG: flagellar biosynthesis anti-sigma factor FlgM [Armatimonadota bacterium]
MREELVREIKDRIARGDYEVSGEEVAEMMLRRLAADRMR